MSDPDDSTKLPARADDDVSMTCDRRRFVQVSSAGVLALSVGGLGCDDDPAARRGQQDGGAQSSDSAPTPLSAPMADRTVFPSAALAGSMTTTSAIVCGYSPSATDVQLKVWAVDTPDQAVLEQPMALADGYVKFEVEGLAPGTGYGFAFFTTKEDATEVRSSIGRFQTAPAADARPTLTIGATACTKFTYSPFDSLTLLAQQDFDIFCQLGDMSYNDFAETREAYRGKWQQILGEEGYGAIFSRAGMYQTWDDHEIVNSSELPTISPERLEAGVRAFYESLPAREGEDGRLWTSYRWGQTAEIFVLDCRLERRPETRATSEATYIGRAQMDWLKGALADSPCHFKIVLNSVPITKMSQHWPAAEDRWQGYPAQRDELLDFLDSAELDNVWFISGDLHLGSVNRVDVPGRRRNRWEVLVGPGGTISNPLALAAETVDTERDKYFPQDQFIYFNYRWSSTTLTFDPDRDAVRVVFTQAEDGAVTFDRWLSQTD